MPGWRIRGSGSTNYGHDGIVLAVVATRLADTKTFVLNHYYGTSPHLRAEATNPYVQIVGAAVGSHGQQQKNPEPPEAGLARRRKSSQRRYQFSEAVSLCQRAQEPNPPPPNEAKRNHHASKIVPGRHRQNQHLLRARGHKRKVPGGDNGGEARARAEVPGRPSSPRLRSEAPPRAARRGPGAPARVAGRARLSAEPAGWEPGSGTSWEAEAAPAAAARCGPC